MLFIHQVIEACVTGGARVFEFTNRGDHAYQIFSELTYSYSKKNSTVILGAGSIVDAPTAAIYINSGANFIVGPFFNPEVAKLCNRRKVAYLPGCASMAEISNAEEAGVEIVKLFPGETVGGPEFVKAVLGPSPWTRIMPTGIDDVSKERIVAWFNAGVACIGIGSKLISKEILVSQNYGRISIKVKEFIEWIREARL